MVETMLSGSSVYETEVMQLLRQLEAKGILLVVIGGKKNKSDIEFASALAGPDAVMRVIYVLQAVTDELLTDLARIHHNEQQQNGRKTEQTN